MRPYLQALSARFGIFQPVLSGMSVSMDRNPYPPATAVAQALVASHSELSPHSCSGRLLVGIAHHGSMSEVWTHGTWTVIAGRESEFVSLWEQLGDWTVEAFPGARGTLLRDTERPNVFISSGPWPDRETASRWRASAEFQRHVAAIKETLELFEPRLLEPVAAKH